MRDAACTDFRGKVVARKLPMYEAKQCNELIRACLFGDGAINGLVFPRRLRLDRKRATIVSIVTNGCPLLP